MRFPQVCSLPAADSACPPTGKRAKLIAIAAVATVAVATFVGSGLLACRAARSEADHADHSEYHSIQPIHPGFGANCVAHGPFLLSTQPLMSSTDRLRQRHERNYPLSVAKQARCPHLSHLRGVHLCSPPLRERTVWWVAERWSEPSSLSPHWQAPDRGTAFVDGKWVTNLPGSERSKR